MSYKFRRQKIIWSFILDFYCSKLLLGIEVDGAYHNQTIEYDTAREQTLSRYGIVIVRFTNDEVEKKLEWVILALEEFIREREKCLWLMSSF